MGETSDSRMKRFLAGQSQQMGDAARPQMHARVDAAVTHDENKRHWANADALSADAAYDPATRAKLRNRSRYETLNNCYAKQVVRSSAADLIGTGPRLQLSLTPPRPQEAAQYAAAAKLIERAFAAWMDETQFAINLRVAEKSRVRDGECLGIFDTNERLDNPVKFDIRWVEAEMCTSPPTVGVSRELIDGIKFDRLGKPLEYYFLKYHPGGLFTGGLSPNDFITVPAKRVLHWFALERFGQHRAIPEMTPALPLYSQVRRYTLATLTAAEFASCLAGIMRTTASSEDGPSVTSPKEWDLFEMVRGALLTLPDGWDAAQFKSEQPTATYAEFKRELLNESGCATGHPLNRVTGNSSGYNYSSAKCDLVPFQNDLRIRRNDLRMVILDRVFAKGWYPEALMLGGIIPAFVPPIQEWRWVWNWDGFGSLDPNKDAMADDSRLKNGTASYSEILAEWGQNWEEVFDQIAREKSYAQSLGLPYPIMPGAMPAAGAPTAADEPVSPDNVQEAVAAALEEAKVGEQVASDVMALLAPAFASLRKIRIQTPVTLPTKPAKNGAASNGHTFTDRF